MALSQSICGLLVEYDNPFISSTLGRFKINILCFEILKDAVNFEDSIWLNYNKTVLNSTLDNFTYLEKESIFKIFYLDTHEKFSHIYETELYENHIAFFDKEINQAVKNSFRFDSIENCEISSNMSNTNSHYRALNKKCCINFNVKIHAENFKTISLCSLNKFLTLCIVEVKNLQKTLTDSCKKFVANRKYYEINRGSQYKINANNCSTNTTTKSEKNYSNDPQKYFISNSTYINIKPINNYGVAPTMGLGPQLYSSSPGGGKIFL